MDNTESHTQGDTSWTPEGFVEVIGPNEDFTLPHRVSLDSTWSPRGVVESLWSLCGLSFAGSSAKFMYKVPVES